MSLMEEQIVELYDNCPEHRQIIGLAKMYATTEGHIKSILQKHGREIYVKRGPKPKKRIVTPEDGLHCPEYSTATQKQEVKTEISNSNILVPEKVISKIPDCVAETITKRINELEVDIKNHQDMVRMLEAEYTAHVNFLMNCPFEQGNLSHNCSDDKIESPQPQG